MAAGLGVGDRRCPGDEARLTLPELLHRLGPLLSKSPAGLEFRQ